MHRSIQVANIWHESWLLGDFCCILNLLAANFCDEISAYLAFVVRSQFVYSATFRTMMLDCWWKIRNLSRTRKYRRQNAINEANAARKKIQQPIGKRVCINTPFLFFSLCWFCVCWVFVFAGNISRYIETKKKKMNWNQPTSTAHGERTVHSVTLWTQEYNKQRKQQIYTGGIERADLCGIRVFVALLVFYNNIGATLTRKHAHTYNYISRSSSRDNTLRLLVLDIFVRSIYLLQWMLIVDFFLLYFVFSLFEVFLRWLLFFFSLEKWFFSRNCFYKAQITRLLFFFFASTTNNSITLFI